MTHRISTPALVEAITDPSLFDASPNTIGPKLAGLVELARIVETAQLLELGATSPRADIRWAVADFMRTSGGGWAFLQLRLALGGNETTLRSRRAELELQLSQRLGSPRSDAALGLSLWTPAPRREITLRLETVANPLVQGQERVIVLEVGVPQGEAE